MPSADRLAIAVVLAVAASGCATVDDALTTAKKTVAPAAAPVPPAVQTAFDDAGRALRAGRAADAERSYRALAQSNPELAGPHANLGVIQRQKGLLAESASELEAAVRLSPQQPVYFNQLGVTYRQQGKFEKAKDAYEKAIALDPAYAAPVLNLGILNDLYFADGARALELYGRYLQLQGNDTTVTKWVADLKNRKPGPVTVGLLKEKE